MAKLSARGRTEVLRATKDFGPDGDVEARRTEYRVMSDGVILAKNSWTRIDLDARRRTESGGWKVPGRTTAVDTFAERLRAQGFTVGAR